MWSELAIGGMFLISLAVSEVRTNIKSNKFGPLVGNVTH